MNEQVAEMAAQTRRELSGRVLAATLRSVRDLDIAEESTADAFLLAIAAEHSTASSFETTNWLRLNAVVRPSPGAGPIAGFALGRCIAVSCAAGPAVGPLDLDEVLRLGGLDRYPYASAARAQMVERLNRVADAVPEWSQAAALARITAEREFFQANADRCSSDQE